jgi:hypothetical protein
LAKTENGFGKTIWDFFQPFFVQTKTGFFPTQNGFYDINRHDQECDNTINYMRMVQK